MAVDGFGDFAAGVADEPGDLLDGDVAVGHEADEGVPEFARCPVRARSPRQCRRRGRTGGRWPRPGAARWRCRTPAPPAPASDSSCSACSAVTASCGRARVRREVLVLVSPLARTDRHTATLAGRGGTLAGSPKSTCSHRSARASSVRTPVHSDSITYAWVRGPAASGGGGHRGGLGEGHAAARPALLSRRGAGQRGHVPQHQVLGLRPGDRPGQRQVRHRHRRAAPRRGDRGQRLVDVGDVQVPQPDGADHRQQRLEDVPVLRDRLRVPAGQPAGEPVLAAPADRVIHRRRAGDAAVDLLPQLLQGVLHGGLARAGDSPPQPPALRAAAGRDLAAPSSRAPAVPRTVLAWAVMLEVNGVIALAAPFRHASRIAPLGDYPGDNCQRLRPTRGDSAACVSAARAATGGAP